MSTVEIFELRGYVLDSFGNPDRWVFIAATSPYAIQRAQPVNTVYVGGLSGYSLHRGRPNVGVAITDATVYALTHGDKSQIHQQGSSSPKLRFDGVGSAKLGGYIVEPDSTSYGMGATSLRNITYHNDGLAHFHTKMYTIEIL